MFRLPVLGGTAALRLLFAIIAISMISLIPRAAAATTEVDASVYSDPTLRDAPVIELAPEAALPELVAADHALQAAEAHDWTAMAIALCVLTAWALRRFTHPLGWAHTPGGLLAVTASSAVLVAIAHALSRPHPTVTSVAIAGVISAALALAAGSNPTTLALQARAASDRALALLVLLVLPLASCAGYTATQGVQCAAAVASALQGSASLALDCRDAAQRGSDAEILACVDDTLAQVARGIAAVPACMPPP